MPATSVTHSTHKSVRLQRQMVRPFAYTFHFSKITPKRVQIQYRWQAKWCSLTLSYFLFTQRCNRFKLHFFRQNDIWRQIADVPNSSTHIHLMQHDFLYPFYRILYNGVCYGYCLISHRLCMDWKEFHCVIFNADGGITRRFVWDTFWI